MKRRAKFISLLLAFMCAFPLVSCTVSTPQATEQQGTTIETVVVEKEVPVEKKVVETVVVEREVIVEKEVVTEKAAAGQLFVNEPPNGADVVIDPAQMPKTFQESPVLAEKVEAGELPPVEERLPTEPLVLQPIDEIGTYSGPAYMAVTTSQEAMSRLSASDKLLFWDKTGTKIVPGLAKSYEQSADGRSVTVHLREGLKWSDGQPFTSADLQFWWEDIYNNREIVPAPDPELSSNGKELQFEVIDEYTVVYKCEEPFWLLPDLLAAPFSKIGAGGVFGYSFRGPYAPKHYLTQFHAKYADKADLDKLIAEAKVESWVALFRTKNSYFLDGAQVPQMSPWITVRGMNTDAWVLERNPYFYVVDTEGNQLPYIDQWILPQSENAEIVNLHTMAGEFDFQYRDLQLAKLPAFLQNGKEQGYNMYVNGSAEDGFGFGFNQSYDADPEIAKWLRNSDFRKALSLGLKREQFNEAFFLGLGVVGSQAPPEYSPQSPGEEYRTLWATYDLEQANALLDSIGLDKKDEEGFRLRTDGEGRLRLSCPFDAADSTKVQQIEMAKSQWAEIGIWVDVSVMSYELYYAAMSNNEIQMFPFGSTTPDIFDSQGISKLVPWVTGATTYGFLGPEIGKWRYSEGEEGAAPTDPKMLEMYELYDQGRVAQAEERNAIAQEMWKIALEELWTVQVVTQIPAWPLVVKTRVGNVPTGLCNTGRCRFPSTARPETFYLKD